MSFFGGFALAFSFFGFPLAAFNSVSASFISSFSFSLLLLSVYLGSSFLCVVACVLSLVPLASESCINFSMSAIFPQLWQE